MGKPVETVPQIFVDQKHIGGCTDFEAWAKENLACSPGDSSLLLTSVCVWYRQAQMNKKAQRAQRAPEYRAK